MRLEVKKEHNYELYKQFKELNHRGYKIVPSVYLALI